MNENKEYEYLIFDLDNTLTDDYENTKEAFKYVMNLKGEEYTKEKFLKFHEIDVETWRARANGEIVTPFENNKVLKTEWIRASRFIKFYGENNISYEDAVKTNNIYMNGMKQKVVSQKNCYETIEYLYKKKYRIIIATNGPLVAVDAKLIKLGIKKFIDVTFSAEEVGFMKPHKIFYDGLLEKANIKTKNKILFIGDDLEKDIKGGIENSIDTCWCNYNNFVNNTLYKPKYEIHELLELKELL